MTSSYRPKNKMINYIILPAKHTMGSGSGIFLGCAFTLAHASNIDQSWGVANHDFSCVFFLRENSTLLTVIPTFYIISLRIKTDSRTLFLVLLFFCVYFSLGQGLDFPVSLHLAFFLFFLVLLSEFSEFNLNTQHSKV